MWQSIASQRTFKLSNYVTYLSSGPVGFSRAILCVRKDIPSSLVHVCSGQAREHVACKVTIGHISICNASVLLVVPVSTAAISSLVRNVCAQYIICGDFNSYNVLWGSTHCNVRGRMVEHVLYKCDLVLLNDASSTFLRGPCYSNALYLALCSRAIRSRITWHSNIETKKSNSSRLLISHPALRCHEHRRLTTVTNW